MKSCASALMRICVVSTSQQGRRGIAPTRTTAVFPGTYVDRTDELP